MSDVTCTDGCRPAVCSHEHQRVDVFKTAVPRSHPGYREQRRVTCEDCGQVETTEKGSS